MFFEWFRINLSIVPTEFCSGLWHHPGRILLLILKGFFFLRFLKRFHLQAPAMIPFRIPAGIYFVFRQNLAQDAGSDYSGFWDTRCGLRKNAVQDSDGIIIYRIPAESCTGFWQFLAISVELQWSLKEFWRSSGRSPIKFREEQLFDRFIWNLKRNNA